MPTNASPVIDVHKAARGFLEAFGQNHVVVDYGKRLLRVCKIFLQFSIRRSKNLHALCVAWVPDVTIMDSYEE